MVYRLEGKTLQYAVNVKQHRKSAIIHSSGENVVGCITEFNKHPLELNAVVFIVGFSLKHGAILSHCSCRPCSETLPYMHLFDVTSVSSSDTCEHVLVFAYVHNITAQRWSAIPQLTADSPIVLGGETFTCVNTNASWGLVP